MGPGVLSEILKSLPTFSDKNLLVGFDTSDDACVYKIDENTAMIQTVDFFPPVVDDPYTFGQIAAANALSDVYAMGGTPTLAMNLLCYPTCLPGEVVQEMLRGGYDKVREAGAIVAGGHTIEDDVPKFGLCVTGFLHPDKVLTNAGAKPGDLLVLTKPIGTGILSTALKAELLDDTGYREMVAVMARLNNVAQQCMCETLANACTDVTGFGLLGHACEMAAGSGVTIKIQSDAVPILEQAVSFAKMGIVPEGAYRNMAYLKSKCDLDENVPEHLLDLLVDPQTSGGLLISLPEENAQKLVELLHARNHTAAVIGQVLERGGKELIVI